MNDNYIFPFLWMRGEPEEIIREEIARIAECGIRAVCVEARPHKDFCGPGWWHDMDIVLDEVKNSGYFRGEPASDAEYPEDAQTDDRFLGDRKSGRL